MSARHINNTEDHKSAGADQPHYFSVTELAGLLNAVLEENFPAVWLEAEISEITRAKSGHVYFTIKDQQAQLACVMWAQLARTLDFVPSVGLKVQCLARPNVYAASGRMQLVISRMLPAGEGVLQKRFQELKAKLTLQGFFAPERKRRIPFFPSALGIVTSQHGAVIHDIMVKIQERMPCLPVYLIDVRVQGEGAALEIARAIERFNQLANVDVVIVARGGGSIEDLWAFNEEIVVQAIFASRIPIVSGVGHEVDVTLCDLVADLRAPTPTAAAEMVVPHRQELSLRIADLERRIIDYSRWLMPLSQRVDELEARLSVRIEQYLERARLLLDARQRALALIEPRALIATLLAKLNGLARSLAPAQALRQMELQYSSLNRQSERLASGVIKSLTEKSTHLERLSSALEALSPQRVLERGFSLVSDQHGIVRSVAQLKIESKIAVQFADGQIESTVNAISLKQ